MLRANVGLSRKISRDYNSTGYSVNLDGEIPLSIDDAQGVMEKVKELFSLAQEALDQEIDRDQGEYSLGRRDEERPNPGPSANGHGNHQGERQINSPVSTPSLNGNSPKSEPNGGSGPGDLATNKQIQFLLTMGKRFKLSTPRLESRIAEIIGRRCSVYELTKKEAGLILDHFTKSANGTGH